MQVMGAFAAKTHFSQLLTDIEHGENFTITKRGIPIALLIPIREEQQEKGSTTKAIERIRALRKNVFLEKKLTIKKLIMEGRA